MTTHHNETRYRLHGLQVVTRQKSAHQQEQTENQVEDQSQ